MTEVGIVGKKCDLYPPKEIRRLLGIKPGQKVVYKVENGKLIVEIIPSIEEAEKLPKFTETTIKEFEKFTKQLQTEAVKKLKTKLKS